MSSSDNIISLNITRFPQNLLIPGIDNIVSIQAINNSSSNENFKFSFEGENLEVILESNEYKDQIQFAPGETKSTDIKLIPTADGYGKITINVNWLKITEYTIKVQKVRETIHDGNFNKIVNKYQFTGLKSIEIFNPNDYVIDMSKDVIKKAEKELENLKKDFVTTGSSDIKIQKDIDNYIRNLCKGYLSANNPIRALELALTLSDKNEQLDFYLNLIRAYGSKNLEKTLQIVDNINDPINQQKLLELLTLDYLVINPEQSLNIINKIKDISTREKLIITIFHKIIESNPLLALKLIGMIEDSEIKIRILFNIAKKLKEQNIGSELVIVLNLLIEKISKVLNINYDKKTYKIFKHAISLIAEIDSPTKADSIIQNLTTENLKEKIKKDLFSQIYQMVDEIKTKIESKLVFSQFYLLNTYKTNITNEIKNFSLYGGNVSNNILINDFNFNIAFLSLFGFDFSIFPILDRVYNDIKYSHKKSIGYFVFPSKANYNENELITMRKSLKQFFTNINTTPSTVLIFNLDFIPYLGKPTVIVSDDAQTESTVISKIKKLADSINLIIDDKFFKGGKITEYLKEIFPMNKCKIMNLVLSYEFINDYNIFKSFIHSLL